MGIDPWGDFEALQVLETPLAAMPGFEEEEESGITLYADSAVKPAVRMYGFSMEGTDQDGDSVNLGLRSLAANYPYLVSTGSVSSTAGTTYSSQLGPDGMTVTDSIVPSKYAWWLGRPGIINGDPMITNRLEALEGSSGQIGIEFSWPDTVTGVAGIQFDGLAFSAFPVLRFFPNYTSTTNSPMDYNGLQYTLNGIDLYINGSRYGTVRYKASLVTRNNVNIYTVAVENYKLTFSSNMAIKRLEFRLNYSNNGSSSFSKDMPGGLLVSLSSSSGSAFVQYNESIILDAPGASGPGGGEGGGGTDLTETNGLLGSIIEWLRGIKDGITKLPGTIVQSMLNMLKYFFLIDDSALQTLKEEYNSLLQSRFGFIYQCFQMMDTAFNEFIEGWEGHGDYRFTFPGITVPFNGETYVLCPPTELDTNNELFTVLRNALGTIFCFVSVLGAVHSLETMFIAIVSGKNYFDYIHAEAAMDAEEGSE